MEFNIGFTLGEPQAAIFADLLDQPRQRYIRERIAEFVAELVVHELTNVMENVNMYNLNLTIAAGGDSHADSEPEEA